MTKKHIIFDFDGTIADTFWVFVTVVSEAAGVTPTDEEIEAGRGIPAMQLMRKYHVPLWKIPSMVAAGRRMTNDHVNEIKVFSNVADIIKSLHAAGHILSIISSNTEKNMKIILDNNDLTRYFSDIVGGVKMLGKAPVLRKLLQSYDTNMTTLYVGDEVRDVEGAQKANVPVAAVTWGYQNETILQQHKPNFIVHSPDEIMDIIKKL